MPLFDLPLAQLRDYRPAVAEPSDFDEFWQGTLAEARAIGGEVTLEPYESYLTGVEVFDITFPGFAGDPIKGWFMLPRDGGDSLPAIVEYIGYNGGRGFPQERLGWVTAGYAYLLMDTRGQGSLWGSGGDTADPHGSGPSTAGFMTRGIDSRETYFYRRVYTDAVRAVDALRGLPRVDPARVSVAGMSQGGGIAIAVAGLVDGLVAAMPDVPFLQHFERSVGLTDADPYAEIVRYLAAHRGAEARVFETLSYFDGVSFAPRATCPAIFSVALMDPICPPSTVFASANRWGADAQVVEYPFNEHEGGQGHHWRAQAAWLRDLLAGS